MPALVTDEGQHAAIQGTVGRIEERLARPGRRAGTPRALTAADGSQAILGCGTESAPCHGTVKPIGRVIEAQPLIKGCGPAWVLAGGHLIAGNGKALILLEPSEGPRG